VVYLLLVELAKTRFYRSPHAQSPRMATTHTERLERRIRRRVSRFVHFVSPEERPPGESGVALPSTRGADSQTQR